MKRCGVAAPLLFYEGFSTYGGISVREIEAMAVGLEETLDFDNISQGPIFIEEMTRLLVENNVPMVTPAGGLGVHLDCKRFVPHILQNEYPAAAVHSALKLGYELVDTLALPRRVFTLSQIKYAVDRITWLYENRELIGGLKFVDEPKVLRFFFGKLELVGNWQTKLIEKFEEDFGDSL